MIKLDGLDNRYKAVLAENLGGIREVICDSRKDKTITGMRAVDGYYKLSDTDLQIRQIRVYDVKSDEEAVERAKKDGLVQGIMVETFLGEPIGCTRFDTLLPKKD